MHGPGFVADLALALGVAAITGFLFTKWKQPTILGYLLAGLIVGPYLPIPLFADPDRIHALSEFGVVLVMFTVGLEFRLAKFLTVLPVCGVLGLVEIAALLSAGYFLGRGLGWGDVQSLFLGACICISSTMAVSKILEQRPIPEHNRRLVYGVLVLQDVAAIALIAVMTAVAQGSRASFGEALGILGKLSAVLLALIAGGMFLVPRFMRALARTASKEVLTVGAVGLCFSFALLAEGVGYSAALGAFMGGILVAESGLGHKVESVTAAVRDVFVAVFFVSIGMSVDPLVAWKMLPTSLLVLGVVVVAQFVSVSLAGTASGNGLKSSLSAGLALGQIGEFAFIIGGIGVSARVLDASFNSVLVTVAVLSTFTTSLALQFRERIVLSVEGALPQRLGRVLVLYETWWQQLREPGEESTPGVRGALLAVGFDFAVMAALIFSWQAWREEIETFLASKLQLAAQVEETLAVVLLGFVLLPGLITFLILGRSLARKLAARLFAQEHETARKAFVATLGILMSVAVGLPVTLVLGRAVGVIYVWPAFLLALFAASYWALRRVDTLGAEVQSGGLMVLQTIAGQGFEEAHEGRASHLPGIRDLTPLRLEKGDFAVGRTLAELQLRSRTGAVVVALCADEGAATVPTGAEELGVGATLYLTGNEGAKKEGERLLKEGPTEPPESQSLKGEPKDSLGPSAVGD